MITNYKQAKLDVLQQYDSFCALLNEVEAFDGSVSDTSLIALKNQAKNISDDKFLLMVVGEAKSGKSTFINAYLGKEILPMDVKQCTSAIVEIRYGEKFILTATYADERVVTYEDEEAIKKFLIENASLDDEYRDIPVPTINIEILMKKCGKMPRDYEIKELMQGIANENLHKLSEADYEAKVRKYITEKTSVWQDIVKKIEIQYPFDDEDLRGIEIVDTPGVNADGRVGEITHEYIAKANAVMFLKPIVGSALEATSFKKFLEGKSADRNRDAMFLILTRSANETPDNVARVRDEAFKQFPGINEHQIIHVDSKVEMFYNRVKDMSAEELVAYMAPLLEEDKLDSFLETPWYKAQFKREAYLQRLKELSNFSVVDESLNRFAHKAHYMALSEFLDRILKVLDAVQGQFSERVENYKKKALDPFKLEAELADKKTALESLKLKINTTTTNIGRQYTNAGGLIEQKADEVAKEYEREISQLNSDSLSSMEELQKATFRQVDKYIKYQAELQREITEKCDAELVSMSDRSKIPFTTLKPDLTPETINAIKENQKNNANVQHIEPGGCFKSSSTRPVFSQSKFFTLVRDDIKGRLESIKTDFINMLGDFVSNVLCAYRSELVTNATNVQAEYDKILNDKAEAEELQKKISDLEGFLASIKPLVDNVTKVKEGVDSHV